MTAVALLLAVLAILLAAWLRSAVTAITRVPRADALREASDGVKGASTVADLLDNREAISPAVGVVASAFMVVGAVLATAALALEATQAGALLIAAAVGLASFLIGDLIPRRLGRLNPERIAYRSHRILRWAVRLGGWANDLLPDTDNGNEVLDDVEDEVAE
jgi:CBS domain containing-hemolysin-like protein